MTVIVRSFGELVSAVTKELRGRDRAIKGALRRAAGRGRKIIKSNVPVAFGELREGVVTEDTKIVVDTPHGAAVNNGSRPHWMPLGPLIAWVKLRGMQGLATERQRGRMPGTTTAGAAQGIAGMLAAREHRGPSGYSDVDAAEQVARMIQRAIAKRGTKPHFFIEKSLPGIEAAVLEELRAVMEPVDFPPVTGEPAGTLGAGSSGSSSAAAKTNSTSGAFRKHAGTFRGSVIKTDHQGNRFADLKNGKRVFLKN